MNKNKNTDLFMLVIIYFNTSGEISVSNSSEIESTNYVKALVHFDDKKLIVSR